MGRPLFLMGTAPLYAMGIAAAWHDAKAIRGSLVAPGLFLVWLVQLMTHYHNEYCDLETDIATEIPTRISGGSRALVKRLVPRTTARTAALISLLLAIVLAIIMVITLDAGALLLGFVGAAAFLGWFYSGKPLKLESTGLGEVINVVVSCFLLPVTSYYLQASTINPGLLVACAPLGLLTFSLILSTEIPDFNGDRATGKKTLPVRLGRTNIMWLTGTTLGVGWLAFCAVIIYVWPFWGWISAAVSISMLVMIGLNMRTANQQYPARVEKIGLIISLLIGYASICFTVAFFLG